MKKVVLILITLIFVKPKIFSQQMVSITDSLPYEADGLKMGYNIVSAREKEVGDKGNFSRYNIQFYVTNITGEAKIILYKQGFNLLGRDASAYLAQFNCTNATGARLTSKEALLQAKPCNVIASVEDKDCSSNKTTQNKRFVQIGYWIKAGETISSKTVVIVPLNQKPDVKVSFLYKNNSLTGSVSQEQNNNNQTTGFGQNFLKIKNSSGGYYINNQSGPATCSPIDKEWWSAQWQLLTVANTNYYVIKNRWKSIYLNNDAASGFSTFNDQALNSMWIVEPVNNGNGYTLKNAVTNTYLSFENGSLKTTATADLNNARWVIE